MGIKWSHYFEKFVQCISVHFHMKCSVEVTNRTAMFKIKISGKKQSMYVYVIISTLLINFNQSTPKAYPLDTNTKKGLIMSDM